MARKRRIAYRKKQQNRFSMFLATLVVVMILVLVGVQSAELRDKIDSKRAEAAQLDEEIAAEVKIRLMFSVSRIPVTV